MSRITAVWLFLVGIVLSSCSVSKHLPAGESLYMGAEVKVVADSAVSAKDAKAVKAMVEPLIRPVPNSSLLGFPYKVWFYYFMGEPTKEKSFRGWFRKRFGEAPVLASRRTVTANGEIVTNYLQNEGYFRTEASGELVEKGRTAKAHYTVALKPRYLIENVEFVDPNTGRGFTREFLKNRQESLLKPGQPYQLSVIEAERQRIERDLKRVGFYYFRPDYLIVKADTNLKRNRVNLYVELKPNTTQLALKRYFIKNVYVISDNGLLRSDTLAGAVYRRGFQIVDPARAYRVRTFADAIGFRPKAMYSSDIQDVSLSRLINLKNFKFVKNRFELLPRSDSALLDVYYYLTPLKKKSLRAELSAVTKSSNLTGSQLNLTWMNRNLFRGAEMLRLTANAGIDVQLGRQQNIKVRDYYRTSVEGELSFPRFVLPFYRMNPAKNQTLPKTTLTVGYEELSQKDFYTQTSVKFNWGYVWRRSTRFEHSFTPISLNLVKPRNISEALVDSITSATVSLQDLLRYFSILENRLILGAQYNFSFTPQSAFGSKGKFVLNAGADIAGNVAGLIAKGRQEVGMVFGIPYEQYARFDADMRYYYDFTPSIRWANRILGGVGIPYGNSFALPQFKQYFAGGSNGIRAFRGRAIGPGSYQPDSLSLFGFTSFGDIRLEANTEFRFKVNQYIETALFADAGNIWMYRNFENSFYFPEDNAVFTNKFYKQVAVGAGLGLRLTLPFLLLRFDLATPLRKPWLPETDRWVIRQMDFGSRSWRKENLVLNIAVGYSF